MGLMKKKIGAVLLSILMMTSSSTASVYAVSGEDEEIPEETSERLEEQGEQTEQEEQKETAGQKETEEPGAAALEAVSEEPPAASEKPAVLTEGKEPAEETEQPEQEETPAELPKESAEQAEEPETAETVLAYPSFGQNKTVDGITVTVSAPEGVFPEGSSLSVEHVSADVQEKVDAAIDEVRPDDVNVAASYTFDIKVLDAQGSEIQPQEGSKVTVSFALAEAGSGNLDSAVYHISDAEEAITAESVSELELSEEIESAVTVETSGFSIYTVEFTYGSLEYVLQGDESVPLSEILDSLKLQGTVSVVSVSNPELFQAEETDAGFVITALQPFTSTEWMKVTIDGIEYEITVTDDIPGDTVTTETTIYDGQTKEGDFTIAGGGYVKGPNNDNTNATFKNGTVTVEANAKNDRKGGVSSSDGSAFLIHKGDLTFDNYTIAPKNKCLTLNLWADTKVNTNGLTIDGSNAKWGENDVFLLVGAYPGGKPAVMNLSGENVFKSVTGSIAGGDNNSVINVNAGTLTIIDSTINVMNGVRIVVKSGAELVIDKSTLKDARIENSGTVIVKNGSDLVNCKIINNNSTLTVADSKISEFKNFAGPVNGVYETAICGDGATITLTNTELDNNHNYFKERSPDLIPGASIISIKHGSITMDSVYAHDNGVNTNGGVMHAVDTEVEIRNSTFIRNSAWYEEGNPKPSTYGPWYGKGGALFIEDDHVTIVNTTFDGNWATEGGAVFVKSLDEDTMKAEVNITDCTFQNNRAARAGGALVDWGNGTQSVIKGVKFLNNTAVNKGGAMMAAFDKDPKGITIGKSDKGPTEFKGNTVTRGTDYAGGALFIEQAHVSMDNTAIYENTAPNAGGGLSTCEVGTVEGRVLDGVAIFDNHVTDPKHEDGGMYQDVYLSDIGEHHESDKVFPYYPFELYERMFNGGFHKWNKKEMPSANDLTMIAQSDPTNKDVSKASVIFTGNSVTAGPNQKLVSGGAIACNGLLTIGTGTELKAVKIWDDFSDSDGLRPSADDLIKCIRIKANGDYLDMTDRRVEYKVLQGSEADDYILDNNIALVDEDGIVVKFSEEYADKVDNAWLIIIDGDFPRYDEQHKIINYVVEEDISALSRYYQLESSTGNMDSYFEITNRHTPEKIDIPVKKVWDDNNNQDGHRPKEITVKLLEDGEYYGKELTLNEKNEWHAKFEGLPRVKNGKEVLYTIEELPVAGYDEQEIGSDEYGFELINVHNPFTTEIPVQKFWDDSNNQDGHRPETVTVRLLEDGVYNGREIVLNEVDEWKGYFNNLPVKKDGKDIVYTVEELPEAGYDRRTEGNAKEGFRLTNTHVPNTTEIVVSKFWDDSDNQDGHRPAEVTVRLLEDGVYNGRELVLKAVDDWKNSFNNLPARKDGKDIVYTIEEVPVAGYDVKLEGNARDGIRITNTHKPNTIEIPVIKKWANDTAGDRPKTITFRLYANGKDTGRRLVIDAVMGWKGYFNNLPAMENGKEISYQAAEEEVEGYRSETSGNQKDGFTFTNTRKPGPTPTPTPTPKPRKPVPFTNDPVELNRFRMILGMASALVIACVYALRKYR